MKELFNDDFASYIKVRNTKHQSFARMQQIEHQRLCNKQCKQQHPPSSDPHYHLLKQIDLIERNIDKIKKHKLLSAELMTLTSFENTLGNMRLVVIEEKKLKKRRE